MLDRVFALARSGTNARAHALVAGCLLAGIALGCSSTRHSTREREPAGQAGDAAGRPPTTDMPAVSVPTEPVSQPPSSVPASGGQSGEGGVPAPERCSGTRWTDLSSRAVTAICARYDGAGHGHYHCSCNGECSSQSPVFSEIPNADLDGGGDDCPIAVATNTCAAALEQGCGMKPGNEGFCRTADITCFDQPDGSYRCHCPGSDEPVTRTDKTCDEALRHACVSDCESAAGSCTAGDDEYACTCARVSRTPIGFTATQLCPSVLASLCEPACANARGECFWRQSPYNAGALPGPEFGGATLLCYCGDDPEPHTTTTPGRNSGEPLFNGSELCLEGLARACGS